MSSIRFSKILSFLFCSLVLIALCCVAEALEGFKTFTDPQKRFSFEFPGTMNVEQSSEDEVKIFHPKATLRINVFIEKRRANSHAGAPFLLETLKKRLQEEMKQVVFIEEGKSPHIKGSQGFIICSFVDSRGIKLTQLIQYYVTEDRILQMIVSDKTPGFQNLEKIIRYIHQSLRILNPALKPV
jgi:hypothetical protein